MSYPYSPLLTLAHPYSTLTVYLNPLFPPLTFQCLTYFHLYLHSSHSLIFVPNVLSHTSLTLRLINLPCIRVAPVYLTVPVLSDPYTSIPQILHPVSLYFDSYIFPHFSSLTSDTFFPLLSPPSPASIPTPLLLP